MLNKIGTKIIGGYMLFVVLVLSFLGASYWLMTGTVGHTQAMYDHTEQLRVEMEAHNVFWKQVSAMTDYFLFGDEKYLAEFHEHGQQFSQQIVTFIKGKMPEEEGTLRQLADRYDAFNAKFNKAVTLFKAGHRAEALRVETEEVDPAGEEVVRALEDLITTEKSEVNKFVANVRAVKRYAGVFPFLSTSSHRGGCGPRACRVGRRL